MARDTSRKRPTGTSAHSRRAFLKGLGAAGAAVPLAAIAAGAASLPDVISDTGSKEINLKTRRDKALDKRLRAAKDDRKVKVPPHPNNGDEALYPSGIANYTK